VHFTHDLGQIPPAQRPTARASAGEPAQDGFQTYATPHTMGSAKPSPRGGHAATLRIPFERRGTLMLVEALLNDRLTAPFLVDTGASGVMIPEQIASQLGLRIGSDTPRAPVQTANGVVAAPVVSLDSVQLGAARVEGLEALVSSSMSIGLLGGTFFNNFVYQIDAAASEISLVPNDAVRAGLSEAHWRERFRSLREVLTRIEGHLAQSVLTDESRVKELESRRASFASELERLDREADLAQVPQAWRE
jgi:clan AA aspartic protease (TIGR02281 family)